jgi:hypothetical protein
MGGVMNALAVPFHINLNTNMIKKTSRDQTWDDVVKELQSKNAQ